MASLKSKSAISEVEEPCYIGRRYDKEAGKEEMAECCWFVVKTYRVRRASLILLTA